MGGYIFHKTFGENTKLSQLLWSIQKPYMNHLLPYIWHHTLLIHTRLQRKPNLSQGKTEIKLLEVALRKFDLEGLINKTSDPQMALQRTWLSRVNQSWEGSYETTPYISLNTWLGPLYKQSSVFISNQIEPEKKTRRNKSNPFNMLAGGVIGNIYVIAHIDFGCDNQS